MCFLFTEQESNVRKNFTDSFSIYQHKLAFEVRMDYGFTETASPDYWDQMLAVYKEMIATTNQPFLRVM